MNAHAGALVPDRKADAQSNDQRTVSHCGTAH
jgi:hypothetical protein